jgi:hypothetical protein
MEFEMSEIEEAQARLDKVRRQRIWAGQQRDFKLEQALATESYERWREYEQLRATMLVK